MNVFMNRLHTYQCHLYNCGKTAWLYKTKHITTNKQRINERLRENQNTIYNWRQSLTTDSKISNKYFIRQNVVCLSTIMTVQSSAQKIGCKPFPTQEHSQELQFSDHSKLCCLTKPLNKLALSYNNNSGWQLDIITLGDSWT